MRLKLNLFLLAILLFTSCKESGETSINITTPKRVKCEEVAEVLSLTTEYILPGKVEASKEVNLSFRVAGVIERYYGTNGTFVREGDTLVYMDSRDYQLQYSATKAEYNAIAGEANRIIELYEDKSVSENDYNKAVNGLKQITAKLNAHKNALDDTRIIAPFDGYIQKLNYSEGETVGAGMPVVSFVAASSQEVVVNIPYSNYIKQRDFVGATASIAQMNSTIVELKLLGVSPKANLNQLYAMRFAVVPNDEVVVTAGMGVMVTLNYKTKSESRVVIPLSSIFEKGGKSYVWSISSDSTTLLTEVQIDQINSKGEAKVTSGLKSGDIIITAGVNSIVEGMKVEAIKQKSVTNIGGLL